MIRINLASAKASSGPFVGSGGPGEAGAPGGASEETRKAAMVKALVLLMFPAALFVYEQQNIPTIRGELVGKQAHLAELETFNAQAEQSVKEIKKFKEDERKIQARIAALEKIAKDRFREVKVLDLFQQVVPERLWLSKVDVKDGKVLLAGYSTSDIDISTFMDSLSKSVFLQDVVLISSSEYIQEGLTLKKFEVSCYLDRAGVHQ